MNLKLNNIIPAVTLTLSFKVQSLKCWNEDFALGLCVAWKCNHSTVVVLFKSHSQTPALSTAENCVWLLDVFTLARAVLQVFCAYLIFAYLYCSTQGGPVLGLLSGSHEIIENQRFHGFSIDSNAYKLPSKLMFYSRVPIGWHYSALWNSSRSSRLKKIK